MDSGTSVLKIERLPLEGLMMLTPEPFADERGRFVRVFCDAWLPEVRPNWHLSQVNISLTRHRGTIRGMHFQAPPHAECKLIRCLRGSVWDVALDVRKGSPTFLQWHAVEVRADIGNALLIPEGFAHGFQSLSDDAELLYMHTRSWNREAERGVRYDDPRVGISWPLAPQNMSDRDLSLRPLDDSYDGVLM